MGSLKSLHGHLKNLQSQAKNMTETGLALNALFAKERTRLGREGEASRLRAVYRATVERLQRVKEVEVSASHGYTQAKLKLSLGVLAVGGMIKMSSKNRRLSAFADYLLKNPIAKEQPFGLALICIGPRGLPEDVQVVAISQLARESDREQPEVIDELRERGYLLFSEKAFSLLIDRLVGDIRAGRLRLPVSREKLSKITASSKPKLRASIIEVEQVASFLARLALSVLPSMLSVTPYGFA